MLNSKNIQLPKTEKKPLDIEKYMLLAKKVKVILEEERQNYLKDLQKDDENNLFTKLLY